MTAAARTVACDRLRSFGDNSRHFVAKFEHTIRAAEADAVAVTARAKSSAWSAPFSPVEAGGGLFGSAVHHRKGARGVRLFWRGALAP
jgi:hypothetical protein